MAPEQAPPTFWRMERTRALWIGEALVSALAVTLVYRAASGETGALIRIELALFALAFLLTTCLGGAGRVLALGAGLGVAFATLAAISASGFLSPPDMFAIGLIIAGALYPAWALGVGLGALVRSVSAGRSNR